jgi:glycosyltransferase involved in cell wall biosynthesis
MKRVLITGSFKFPNQDAAAIRVYSIAKLFGSEYEINIAGWEKNYIGSKNYIFDNFKCYSRGDLEYEDSFFIVNIFRSIFRGYKTFIWILKKKKFDVIILYNPPSIFSISIILLSFFNRTKLILDSTEWYEPKHLSKYYFSFSRIENAFRMFFVYKLFKNFICISTYLKNYYKKNSITIPPLFLETKKNKTPKKLVYDETINFLYAGQMGQKDNLKNFIDILPDISKLYKLKLKLTILGMTENDMKKNLGNTIFEKSKMFLNCLGKVEKKVVEEYYNRSHFIIFFRQNKRYANAGFPSKSVESWQHGVPIITNNIGELKNYLKDNINSLIINDDKESLLSLGTKLNCIINDETYTNMIENSYETFEQNFTVKKFTNKFNVYLDKLFY